MNRVLLFSAALLAMAAVGCGSAGESAAPAGHAPAPATAPPAAPAPREVAAAAQPAPQPQTPLQTVQGADAAVRLELMSVQRTGPAVVTAHMRLVAAGEMLWTNDFREDGATDNDFSGTRMVDEVHAKQYLALRDAAGECLCTRGLDDMTYIDGPMDVSVKFPAPEADVDRVSVQVPTFASFDAVPLS
jgi:hypothetical protein